MREAIEEILRLQKDFSAENTEAMQRRGELIRNQLAGEVRELLPAMAAQSGIDDLQVQGRDASGSKSRYPWISVYSKSGSPRPTDGWHLVFLFSRLGRRAVLSLNQGTNHSVDGVNRQRPAPELNANTARARNILTGKDSFPAKWTTQIDLESQGSDLGSGYELGNIVGVEYPAEAVPSDEDIKQDLLEGLGLLARLYGASDELFDDADPSDDLDWLLRETLWRRGEVDDVLDTVLTRRPQIILAGPPGTGKTWVAERIGRFLTGGHPDAVHVVQFHPSYAYEDFVEGLRPVASEGQVAFEVVPGALIKVADHARRVDHPVVLVIDEMNRANLPSVFGELLYLLEYRDKEISLLHRDRFSLPPNLYVIGTMNTADRSIRSVDTALRRRFDIFDCPPRSDILDAYYSSAGNNSEVFGLAEGLHKLNDMLTHHLDHHHTVGHSFLMAKHFTHRDLRRTWLRQIRPLIEEYFFDQPDLVGQFDLTTFWPSQPSL
jgi:hypothetical protein